MSPLTAADFTWDDSGSTRTPVRAPVPTPGGFFADRSKPWGEEPVVTITRSAYDEIVSAVKDDPLNHLETGGVLAGNDPADERSVSFAGPLGKNTARSRTTFQPTLRELQTSAGQRVVRGIYHSHPDTRAGDLSGPDLDSAAAIRDAFHRPIDQVVMIVVSEGEPPARSKTAPRTPRYDAHKRWANPLLTCWLVGRREFQRAHLEITNPPRQRMSTPRASAVRVESGSDAYVAMRVAAWRRDGVGEAEIARRLRASTVDHGTPGARKSSPGREQTRTPYMPITFRDGR